VPRKAAVARAAAAGGPVRSDDTAGFGPRHGEPPIRKPPEPA